MRNDDIKSWSRISTVGELIEKLKKYPTGARIKTYPINWDLRSYAGGDVMFSSDVLGIETCIDNKTVSIVTGMK